MTDKFVSVTITGTYGEVSFGMNGAQDSIDQRVRDILAVPGNKSARLLEYVDNKPIYPEITVTL